MTVYVNGEARDLPPGTTVADLAANVRGCAVAVDGAVVPRGQWTAYELRDEQRVEIVHAVQGG